MSNHIIKMLTLNLLALLLIAWSCVGLARNITGVTVEWPPHYGSTMEDGGALTAIVKEAFRRAGHQTEINFIPWNRALRNVQEGKDDFVMGAYYNEERAATYHMSDAIYSIDLGLVALESLDVLEIDNLKDLTPYTIGVSRGYANTEEFDQAEYLVKEIASSPKLNLRKLFRNRVDMIIGAFDIFRHQAKLENLNVRKMVFVQPPLQQNGLHLMASREVSDGQELIEGFNNALAEMREDGTLDQYLSKYLNRN